MDLDVPYSKFKILFINVFTILYKAATLNPYKLSLDLREASNRKYSSPERDLKPMFIVFMCLFLLLSSFVRWGSLQIKNVLQKSSGVPLLPHLLILLISLLLVAKFLFGYISLAANVVAIFPILSEEQPELLLPTIISQAVENIMLAALEILLAVVTVKYLIPGKMSLLVIFITKMIIKMSLNISTLNIYSDLYTKIKLNMIYNAPDFAHTDGDGDPNEEFVSKQTLM